MPTYRDLVAWQVARESALQIYRYADREWKPQRAAALDQLRRASLSATLNIAEGHASGRGARCRYHLRIAHGSAVEAAETLEFLAELGEPVSDLIPAAKRTAALTFGLWRSS